MEKPETLDEYEDLQGDRRYLKTQKELKMEEKAREKRMQEEDRELLYGEKDRRKRAKKEEKERRKKIRTGGFVDEIYEDDLEEERPVRRQERSGVRPENMQAATSEAHELLKKRLRQLQQKKRQLWRFRLITQKSFPASVSFRKKEPV